MTVAALPCRATPIAFASNRAPEQEGDVLKSHPSLQPRV